MRYLLLPVAVFLLTLLPLAGAKQGVSIFVNGRYIGQGEVRDGKTFVPLRLVSESLGAEVSVRPDGDRIGPIQKNRRVTFDRIDISLGAKPLREYEGAWDPAKIDAFLAKVEAWYNKTEMLAFLFDPATVVVSGDLGRRMTQAIRDSFKSFEVRLYAFKTQIAALRRDPYILVDFDYVFESLMYMGQYLSELGRLHEISGITGAPGIELAAGYVMQSTAAHDLLNEVSPHQQALLLWYQVTAGIPKW